MAFKIGSGLEVEACVGTSSSGRYFAGEFQEKQHGIYTYTHIMTYYMLYTLLAVNQLARWKLSSLIIYSNKDWWLVLIPETLKGNIS